MKIDQEEVEKRTSKTSANRRRSRTGLSQTRKLELDKLENSIILKLDKLELGLEKIIEFSSFEEGVIHISRDQIFNIFRPPTPSVIKHDLTPSPTMIMSNFFSLKNRHFNVKMEIFSILTNFFDFDQFFRF